MQRTICEYNPHSIYSNCINFVLNRLSDRESLFHYKPLTERLHKTGSFFCLCSLHNTRKIKQCNNCESKCRGRQNLLWPTVARERDITKRIQLMEARRKSEYRGNTSNEFYRYEQNLPNQFNLSNHDPSDSLLAVLAVISYCKRLLTNSPLARACAPIIGQRNVEQLVKICIRDIRVNI